MQYTQLQSASLYMRAAVVGELMTLALWCLEQALH